MDSIDNHIPFKVINQKNKPKNLLINPYESEIDSSPKIETMRSDMSESTDRQFFNINTVDSSCATPRKRSSTKRKEPEREFFEMTVLAFQLAHSNSKSLMELDRNKLFYECKSEHPMF